MLSWARVARIVIALAFLLTSAIAACALADLLVVIWTNVQSGGTVLGPVLTAMTLGGALLTLAAVVLTSHRRASWSGARPWLIAGIGTLVLTRVVVIATIHPPLISDWLHYHDMAVAISRGGPWFAARPSGLPLLLAPLYLAFGAHPIIGEILSLLAATGAGLAIFALGRAGGRNRTGGVALCLYAVAPAQILMTSVLGTEIIYGALLVAATWATLRFVSWKGASTGGLLLGMSQYVRSTSLVLLPVLLAAAWMLGRPTPGSRRSHLDGLGRVTIMAIAFLVILLPVAAWNTQLLGWPSVSTSSFQNWELLLGTNQVYDGRFNAADVALVGGTPGTAEAEAIAGQLAWERIRDDPLGTAGLFARKFPQAWADEHYGARWALYESPGSNPVVVQAAVLLSQAWLAVLAVLAAIGFWSARRRPAPAMTATAALLLVYAIALMPLEANPRYHAPMVPLLCIPAAFGAVMLGAWWSASRRGT